MGTDLKKFVCRALRDARGVELSLDEVGIALVEKNPITGKIDIHASVVLNNAVTRIVVSASEVVEIPKETPKEDQE